MSHIACPIKTRLGCMCDQSSTPVHTNIHNYLLSSFFLSSLVSGLLISRIFSRKRKTSMPLMTDQPTRHMPCASPVATTLIRKINRALTADTFQLPSDTRALEFSQIVSNNWISNISNNQNSILFVRLIEIGLFSSYQFSRLIEYHMFQIFKII